MKLRARSMAPGFTLIEVMLSIAIVGLSLVVVMSLLTTFLYGTKGVVNQEEAAAVCPALNAYLANVAGVDPITAKAVRGFGTVYGWIQSNSIPQLYAFSVPVDNTGAYSATKGAPQMWVLNGTPMGGTNPYSATDYTNFTTYSPVRIGRLFYIQIGQSQSVPYHEGVARVITAAGTALPAEYLPASYADALASPYYADAQLPLSVRIYAVSGAIVPATIAGSAANYPVLSYDTSVSR